MDVHGDLSDYLKQMGITEEEAEHYTKIDGVVDTKSTKKKKKKTELFEEDA